MAIQNAEYREFYTTPEGSPLVPFVAGDTPTEQDSPRKVKTKLVNGMQIGIVFNENNEPSESVYTKLFKSVPFKLNSSDRAKAEPLSFVANSDYYGATSDDIKQGLVTVATPLQAKSNNDGTIDKYTRVPRVSQLPTVAPKDNLDKSFNITLIPNNPTTSLEVTADPAVLTRNNFLVSFATGFVNWIKTSYDAIKTYIDSVNVISGTLNTSGSNPSNIQVVTTAPTGTDTKKFTLNVTIGLDNDGTLISNSSDKIASQRAVKQYVDTTVTGINSKASQAALDALVTRVDTINGVPGGAVLKADKSDLDALILSVANKVSKTGNETVAGIKTFSSSPVVPSVPAGGTSAINEDYLNTRLVQYYTKPEVDALLNAERIRITNLETQMTNVLNIINNLPANYYTKTQVDTLLSNKADLIHNHNGVYHPFVVGALSSSNKLLTVHSKIDVTNGIVVNITT